MSTILTLSSTSNYEILWTVDDTEQKIVQTRLCNELTYHVIFNFRPLLINWTCAPHSTSLKYDVSERRRENNKQIASRQLLHGIFGFDDDIWELAESPSIYIFYFHTTKHRSILLFDVSFYIVIKNLRDPFAPSKSLSPHTNDVAKCELDAITNTKGFHRRHDESERNNESRNTRNKISIFRFYIPSHIKGESVRQARRKKNERESPLSHHTSQPYILSRG